MTSHAARETRRHLCDSNSRWEGASGGARSRKRDGVREPSEGLRRKPSHNGAEWASDADGLHS